MINNIKKLSASIITIIISFFLSIFLVTVWHFYSETQKNEIKLPHAKWETIFFKEINQVTNLGELTELRETILRKGDIEVRIWRGFSLDPLEGVILKRISGQWSAFYIVADQSFAPESVQLRELAPPKSGWNIFWKQITDKGILTITDNSVLNCDDGGLDMISYVVEINQDRVYRTFKHSGENCSEARDMEEIGDIIGLEFKSEQEECKRTEWFACVLERKKIPK